MHPIFIKSHAFNSSSLKILHFSTKKLQREILNIFCSLSAIEEIDVAGTIFPNDWDMNEIFPNLTTLKVLNLNATNITGVPNALSQIMPRLEILKLQENRISGLHLH